MSTVGAVPALRVGGILGATFATYFRRLPVFAVLGFIPLAAVQAASVLVFGTDAIDPSLGGSPLPFGWRLMLIAAVQSVGYAVVTAFVVRAAYDARLGRPVAPLAYAGDAIRSFVPVMLCSTIVTLLVVLAAIALLVPGLWMAAVWSVVMPAVVIERIGLSALERSAWLTKDYRWPIAGCLVLLAISSSLLGFGLGFVVGLVFGNSVVVAYGAYAAVALQSMLAALSYGLTHVGIALIYARLREIKEGATVENLADVFA